MKLQLFIKFNKLEYSLDDGMFLLWVPLNLIHVFTKLYPTYLTDNIVNVVLKEEYICIDITEFIEYEGYETYEYYNDLEEI